MKICFIAPGEIEIPPKGWGALETVLWNQFSELKKLGITTHFVNERSSEETLRRVKEFGPDIVHLHYGKHFEIMPFITCRKIVTSHDGGFPASSGFHDMVVRRFLRDCHFFCLTKIEEEFLRRIGISRHKINVLSNGVACSSFRVSPSPSLPEKSVCVGKIDKRKRQAMLQKMDAGVDFVGQNTIPEFNISGSDYLGPWDRETLFNRLTNYPNLILLSEHELQPLVCLEALAAGLGLVVSEACTENLDLSKPFITVIPEKNIADKEYVSKAISDNRAISIASREEIVKYAQSFDWSRIAEKYLKLIQ
jgi:glycosyltransferase involved in cell wall biosynthesis